MSIKSKIGGFLKMKSINLTAYAKNKGTTKSNMHQKISKHRVYLKDLLELCTDYNCRISIIDNRTGRELISFNEYDLDDNDDDLQNADYDFIVQKSYVVNPVQEPEPVPVQVKRNPIRRLNKDDK